MTQAITGIKRKTNYKMWFREKFANRRRMDETKQQKYNTGITPEGNKTATGELRLISVRVYDYM